MRLYKEAQESSKLRQILGKRCEGIDRVQGETEKRKKKRENEKNGREERQKNQDQDFRYVCGKKGALQQGGVRSQGKIQVVQVELVGMSRVGKMQASVWNEERKTTMGEFEVDA